MVFIQGVGLHGDGWLPQTLALGQRFRCLSFDNRQEGTITVESMARDTLALMDAVGMPAAHLVGHSFGGVVAQQIAFTAPERVLSLSLLCTSAVGADATRLSSKMLWLGVRSRLGSRRMRRLAFLEIVLSAEDLKGQDRDALATEMEPLFGHDLADSPPSVMRQLGALKRFNGTARLRELSAIRTLVLSAEHDLIFPPRCGRALAAGIAGSKYVEVRGAAHGVTIQHAETVNRELVSHLEPG